MRWTAPVWLQPAIPGRAWEGAGWAVCRKGRWGSLSRELRHSLGLILNSLLELPHSDRQGSNSQLTGSLGIDGGGIFFPLSCGDSEGWWKVVICLR